MAEMMAPQAKQPNTLISDTSEAENQLQGGHMPHDHEDLHVDLSPFYESRQMLHRIRVVFFFFNSIMWAWGLDSDILGFFSFRIRYFTFWGMSMVNFYLMWVIFYFPKRKIMNRGTIIFQQAILMCETLIVIVYWSILAPSMGWGKATSINGVYAHVFPFLFMLHELFVSYGSFTYRGEIAGVIIILTYSIWNTFLAYKYDIIVYKTPYTDPTNWRSFIVMPINVILVYLVGRLLRIFKARIVSRLHLRKAATTEKRMDDLVKQLDQEGV